MFLGDFGDKYFYERILGDLLFLVEDGLVVYLCDNFFFILGIFYLCESICVKV